ncbi:MAG TPA: serine hydrolase domain-containing protein [Candidatus Limnocylindria bacterium]|nr:serine hydrolase domain-containing protein [Candidatus Limnocylindria bacterium]
MRRALPRFFAILLSLCLAFPAAAQAADVSAHDAFVDAAFRAAKTVGGSLVVMKGGEVVYARDWGYKDLTKGLAVDEDTAFRVGSVTKMVTGVGLLKLVEQGKLDLDAGIGDYLGYPVAAPRWSRTPLTLRQLMSHTSSVTDDGGYSSLSSTVRGMLSKKARAAANFTGDKPGSRYLYTNLGAGVAGALAEAVSGVSLDALRRREVFAPLGIRAAYAASLLPDPSAVSGQYEDGRLYSSAAWQLAQGYEDFADPERHYRTGIYSLWITSRDLARLAAALCAGGALDGARVLSPETVEMMKTPQHTLGKSVTGESPYGLFLERRDDLLAGRTVWGHQGMTTGAICNAYFEPQSGFTFVLLQNGGSKLRDRGVGKLARKLLTYTFGAFGE